ncbi:hypothetical protein NUACC21_41450 [Scytonema sp. NUACC21]
MGEGGKVGNKKYELTIKTQKGLIRGLEAVLPDRTVTINIDKQS